MFYILLFSLFLFSTCKKDTIETSIKKTQSENGKLVLGKKIENPYTIDNMKNALDILREEDGLAKEINVSVTDLYVRFLPKDLEEYNELIQNESLDLFDYPLLYEIEQLGNHYHDKDIAGDKPTWQYTVVKEGYSFPNIKYEIISEVFLPSTYKKTVDLKYKNTLAKLEEIALSLVGINEEPITSYNKTSATNWSWYYPEAHIKIPASNNDPVRGVKVIVNHLLHIKSGITDNNGKVTIDDEFLYKVRYKIKWKTHKFRISYGLTASMLIGPYQNATWYCNIIVNPSNNPPELDFNRAMAFIAAYDFMYDASIRGDILEPHRPNRNVNIIVDVDTNPFLNGILNGFIFQLNNILGTSIGFVNINIASHAGFAIFNTIVLYLDDNTSDSRAYTTTIHELGHLSHSVGSPQNYNHFVGHVIEDAINNNNVHQDERAVLESWAMGVEWQISKQKYPNSNIYNTLNSLNPFNSPIIEHQTILLNQEVSTYTQLVLDLIDTINEGIIGANVNIQTRGILPKGSKYIIEDDIIYYTPDQNTGACPVPNTFLAPNHLCLFDEIPTNDPFLTYEIHNLPSYIRFFTWDRVHPYDRVSGYTIKDIQQALFISASWQEWRTGMNSFVTNPTSSNLEELYNNWYQ